VGSPDASRAQLLFQGAGLEGVQGAGLVPQRRALVISRQQSSSILPVSGWWDSGRRSKEGHKQELPVAERAMERGSLHGSTSRMRFGLAR